MNDINDTNELWKPIFGYEGLYEVSNLGRIKSLPRFIQTHSCGRGYISKEKISKPTPNPHGYLFVKLCKNGVQKCRAVHRVVAESFVCNDHLSSNLDVHHKDRNIQNNHLSNLEILTEKQHQITQAFNRVKLRKQQEKLKFETLIKESTNHQQTIQPVTSLTEEWKPIVGWERQYEVSTYGRVRSIDRIIIRKGGTRMFFKGKLLLSAVDNSGQIMVKLSYAGFNKSIKVSRLVAITFILNPDNKRDVHHKDRNKTNNRVDNLEWLTREEHYKKDKLMGKWDSIRGTNSVTNRFSENDIKTIRDLYSSGQHTQTDIAKQYDCFPAVISNIVNYKSWKHI